MKVERSDKTIGVAVSGGMDSMAMLYCYQLVDQKMVVINFEHGIRGDSSQKDSLFVQQYCQKNNIEYKSFSFRTPEQAKKLGESIETTARRLRYQVFEQLLEQKVVDSIALAHHADDNAETLLMRIFRGTGITGLRGITERDKYIRPLLKYSRAEIASFVAQNNIEYIDDETNFETEYTRNFIRIEVLPKIKLRYPSVCKALERLSQNATEIEEYFESKIDNVFLENQVCRIENGFLMDTLLLKYAIRKAFCLLNIYQDIESRHVDNIIKLQENANNTSIDMPFGIRATRHNHDLLLTKAQGQKVFNLPFNVEDTYCFNNVNYRFEKAESIVQNITLDYDKIPDGAVVRSWQSGDMFKSVNGKTKLLSDYLNQLKLSSIEKENVLVLAFEDTVLAILGYQTSDLTKVDSTTKNIIHIIKEYTYDEK